MNTIDNPPHYMQPDTDCMGYPTPGYWRQFLTCSDGKCVVGTGKSSEQAAEDAARIRQTYEEEIKKSPMEQLRKICEGGDVYSLNGSSTDAIRLIYTILKDSR